jgi:predicted RecB family nuclease
MRMTDGKIRLSPTDLSHFLDCKHIITLDMARLNGEEIPVQETDEFAKIITQNGINHEKKYLSHLQTNTENIVEIREDLDYGLRLEQTISALKTRTDIVYQGYLSSGSWGGVADFLERDFDYTGAVYKVVDTKLSRTPKPSHISQVIIYAILLNALGIDPPKNGQIVSPSSTAPGAFSVFEFGISDYIDVVQSQMDNLEAFIQKPKETRPIPCQFCDLCRYKDHCRTELKDAKSIFELPYTTKLQEERLRDAGILSLDHLSSSPPRPPSITPKTYKSMVKRAQLRLPRLEGGEANYEFVGPGPTDEKLELIPVPSDHDIFFDIEGDPFVDGGLEYLFGLLMGPKEADEFIDIWSHTSLEEKEATRRTISILYETCLAHKDAHIYHYNAYEVNALRKLSQKYEVLEDQLDALLRANRFIDLYPITARNIVTSEKGISLKDLEVFFLQGNRDQEVQSAASSVVMYEKWIEAGEPQILEEIRLYNEQDCRSLPLLRDWLIRDVFPDHVIRQPSLEIAPANVEEPVAQLESEEQIILDSLVKYHKREAKPYWWGYFDAMTAADGELVLDSAVLAACSHIKTEEQLYHYSFPEQEHKFSVGESVSCILRSQGKSQRATISSLDENKGVLVLRSTRPLEALIHVKENPAPTSSQIEARLQSVATPNPHDEHPSHSASVRSCITKINTKNNIEEQWPKTIIEHPNVQIPGGVTFVQGPPGSGKTYQGALFLSNLHNSAMGKLCIVTAQSHSAINHLLIKSAEMTESDNVVFIKYGGTPITPDSKIGHLNTYRELATLLTNHLLAAPHMSIVLGITVYGVSKLYNDFTVPRADYLVIDEAGQYSLANAVACASVAENVILLGDQNQLPNVVQGTHPNNVGSSIMSFCLGMDSVVPPENGIFLAETRRLHPKICSFISDKFYQGNLHPHESTAKRKLISKGREKAIDMSGIHIEQLSHQSCTQRSLSESEHILNLIKTIKSSCLIEIDGASREIKDADFIVIAPFNAQVKLLKSKLEETIRVGTVDKFQGQEAAIALISMTSSSGLDAPKGIDFLLNRNRLNVAISRAQIACFVVCAEGLFGSKCNTVEQLSLLSTFTSLKRYSDQTTTLPMPTINNS